MPKFIASYEFPQDPDCIYGILTDVERMREFMPLCKRSEIRSRQSAMDAEVVEANFLLRYRQIDFEHEFDLVLTLRPVARQMEVTTADTTFGSGSARYTVTGAGRSGSRLAVEADYRMRSLLLRILFGRRLVRRGMDGIIAAIRQRAEALAGR
jgi:ribosome-associated toxin RatA of RatAB toxin-antitoxin module